MNDTLVGVIIGAVAAIIGGVLAQLISFALSNAIENKSKMKEAYEITKSLIFLLSISDKHFDNERIIDTLEKAKIKMSLYAKKKTSLLFDDLIEEIIAQKGMKINETFNKKIEQLNQSMKADLK